MRRDIDADSPAAWIEHAKADLTLAGISPPPGVFYELLCFHAQQAAEKAIKAILIHFGANFPYTHNLQRLIEFLPAELQALPGIAQAAALSPYAVLTRYPGETEPVSKEEHEEAVNVASEVVRLAESVVLGR